MAFNVSGTYASWQACAFGNSKVSAGGGSKGDEVPEPTPILYCPGGRPAKLKLPSAADRVARETGPSTVTVSPPMPPGRPRGSNG
jgi:hypothetical protein